MDQVLPNAEVGVIIGRFQVPELHKAHKELIDAVRKRHKKVLVLLGVSPVRITRNNPLDFMTRQAMLAKAYPTVTVLPLKDAASDIVWSTRVDSAIMGLFEEAPALIYGSRDSFIPHYKGRFKTIELAPKHNISGSEVRQIASEEVRRSKDFRAGVVYAAFNRYPISYQAVDAAIIKEELLQDKEVLMAKKDSDGGQLWRFFGGFVRPEDESLEEAVKREAHEETNGMATHEPKYIGSYRIQDWRYANETDKILTSFFALPYMYGAAEGADDVDDAEWFKIKDLKKEEVVPEHHVLLDALKTYCKITKKAKKKDTEVTYD